MFAEKYPAAAEEVKAFRRAHGDKKVGEITVDMASIHINLHMHCSIIIKNSTCSQKPLLSPIFHADVWWNERYERPCLGN